jgi:subtilase family serine protease
MIEIMNRKISMIEVLVLTILLTMPFVTSTVAVSDNTTWNYQVSPKTVPWTYSSRGFLYNTVAELQAAYDLGPLYASGYKGQGQTVVIVDAYGSPTIYEDLLNFIQWQNSHGANLPWTTPAEIQNHLQIYYPTGKPTFNPSPNFKKDQVGWSIETTLDVCMVHAIAPEANIALVIAANSAGNVLNLAVNYAITNRLGSVISQSFGMPEYLLKGNNGQMMQAHNNYLLAAQYGITIFASTGDDGATNGGPFNNALYPSSDPFVTAVGGTNLFMTNPSYTEGMGSWDNSSAHVGQAYSYEIAGNDYEAMLADGYPIPENIVTTGGAMSKLFPLPSWQIGLVLTKDGSTVTPTMRVVSDVSYDSGVYGGLGIIPYSALGTTLYYIVGGTSAGSPFWAALTAIACQYNHGNSLGYINPQLYAFYNTGTAYSLGAFHDIAKGDNTFPNSGNVLGYSATAGWDAPTGIGSPDASKLVPIMARW